MLDDDEEMAFIAECGCLELRFGPQEFGWKFEVRQ